MDKENVTGTTRKQENEYYRTSWSTAESGMLYIKTDPGYTMVSYSKEGNEFHVMFMEFRTNFETMKDRTKQSILQCSKFDALAILQALREKMQCL